MHISALAWVFIAIIAIVVAAILTKKKGDGSEFCEVAAPAAPVAKPAAPKAAAKKTAKKVAKKAAKKKSKR